MFRFIVAIFLFSSSLLFSGQWNWAVNSSNGTFSGTEILTGVSISGTIAQQTSGFYLLTVNASSGTGAPAVGATFPALYSATVGLFTPPILASDVGFNPGVFRGSCPQMPKTITWQTSYYSMPQYFDLRSYREIAFGSGTWYNSQSRLDIFDFSLTDFTQIDTSGTPSRILAGPCQNGVIAVASTGAYTPEGNMWVGSNDSMVFYNWDGSIFFAFAPVSVSSFSTLQGNYVGFMQDRAVGPALVNIGATVDAAGTVTLTGMNPVTGATSTSVADSLVLDSINSPFAGTLTGEVRRGGAFGKLSCMVDQNGATTVSCLGQSPSGNSYSYHVVLMKVVVNPGPGAGNSGGTTPGGTTTPGNGGTPPGQGGTPPGQAKKK